MHRLIAAITISIAGCASTSTTPTVIGNATGGTIQQVPYTTQQDSFEAALRHCARYGKQAKITQPINATNPTWVFDCI